MPSIIRAVFEKAYFVITFYRCQVLYSLPVSVTLGGSDTITSYLKCDLGQTQTWSSSTDKTGILPCEI